jgi:TonB-dependent receptor
MAKGSIPIGSMELRYDAGVRYVRTDQESSGFNSGVFVTVDRDPYDDWLPSGNLALFVTPDLVFRASGARVMTRPGLGSLTPGGTVDSFNFRVSFQNPFRDPTRATALDGSIEWYFADDSLLSFALFYKDIESRPISSERQGTYASTGLPQSLLVPTSPAANNPEGGPLESCNPANGGEGCWTIRSLDNGPGASLWGFEIGFQAPFSELVENLPPIIENMGVIGNFTYVDSDVDYNFGGTIITERLFGLSNKSYNATLYYEDDRLSARISMAARDGYLTATSGTGNVFEGFGGTLNVDFSSTYRVSDRFDVTFEALNLTDDYQDRWTDIDARRRYEWDHTGRVFLLGGRYRF